MGSRKVPRRETPRPDGYAEVNEDQWVPNVPYGAALLAPRNGIHVGKIHADYIDLDAALATVLLRVLGAGRYTLTRVYDGMMHRSARAVRPKTFIGWPPGRSGRRRTTSA